MKKAYAAPTVTTFSSRCLPEHIRQRIVQLSNEGLEGTVIAERLGIHVNSVTNWRRRLGLMATCSRCGRGFRGGARNRATCTNCEQEASP